MLLALSQGPTVTRPILDFSVSAHQTERSLRIACNVEQSSDFALYIQNQYSVPYDFRMGEVGGGRSPNESSRGIGARFTTSTACYWPEGDGSLLVFQGEVPCPSKPFDRRWPQPAYSKLTKGGLSFDLRSGVPVRQWENNFTRAGEGPRLEIRRLCVCIEVLLAPLEVEEIQGVYACDYGQPAYLEEVVELATPIQFITDSSFPKRAEEKRRTLQSYVRFGSGAPSQPGTRRG